MQTANLPILIDVLEQGEINAIREVVDAIGVMCFYHSFKNRQLVIDKLMWCAETYKMDTIIRWKVVMAFSAFNEEQVISWLKEVSQLDQENLIRLEAERSLSLIDKRN